MKDTLETNTLKSYIGVISVYYEVDLYISTWSQTEVSHDHTWRTTPSRRPNDPHHFLLQQRPTSASQIQNYFADLNINIKKILVLNDDSKLELHGNTEGFVASGRCPRIGWKKMWYGIYAGIRSIVSENDEYDAILNTRFDINELPSNLVLGANPQKMLIRTLWGLDVFTDTDDPWPEEMLFVGWAEKPAHKYTNHRKRRLFRHPKRHKRRKLCNPPRVVSLNTYQMGVDNLCVGTLNSMTMISKEFHFNLERVERLDSRTVHQEYLVLSLADKFELLTENVQNFAKLPPINE